MGRVARLALRGFGTGLAGTTAMTTTTWLERRARRNHEIPVDYDATRHVVTAAATVLHVRPRTDAQSRALFLLVHWGYGSAVAGVHAALVQHSGRRLRSAAEFYVLCQSMAFTLFPTAGDTPPPWRWRRDVLASSLAQHLVYTVAVAAADRVAEG